MTVYIVRNLSGIVDGQILASEFKTFKVDIGDSSYFIYDDSLDNQISWRKFVFLSPVLISRKVVSEIF